MKESTFLAECRKCEVPFENTCFLLMGFSIENGSNLFFEQNDSVNEDISHFLSVAITSVLRDVFTEDYTYGKNPFVPDILIKEGTQNHPASPKENHVI